MSYYPPDRRANWRNSMMNPPLKRNVRWQDLVPGNKYILNKGFIKDEHFIMSNSLKRAFTRAGLPIEEPYISSDAKRIMIFENKPHVFKEYYLGALSFERGDGKNISIYLREMKDNFTFTQINERNAANKIRHFMMSRKVYRNAYKPPSGFYYKSALSRWTNTTRKNRK
jgi:hypothetical protein